LFHVGDAASLGNGAGAVIFDRRADVFVFERVELDAFFRHGLREKQPSLEMAQRQAIRPGNSVDMISADAVARTGHVLHEDIRITWNVLAQVAGDGSRIGVKPATRRSRNDDSQCFALVEEFLSPHGGCGRQRYDNRNTQQRFHWRSQNLHAPLRLVWPQSGTVRSQADAAATNFLD
jgi:hypothetical protein